MKRSIVWFKTDLRLSDNETLVRAIEKSDEIIPVYCICPSQFEQTTFGFSKTGKFKAQFLMESLQDLDANLRKRGSGLLVLVGNPEIELLKLVQKFGVTTIYAKTEVGHEEKLQQAAIEKEAWKLNCVVETYSTSTLYHAADLPFAIRAIPDVFSKFRTKTEKEAQIRSVFETPKQIPSIAIPPLNLPDWQTIGLELIPPNEKAVMRFIGGESHGLDRIDHYFHRSKAVANYKQTRNGLLGADYSTKFSPWLALGCISPRLIHEELKKYEAVHGANDSTYWVVFELLWRDYFRFMMKKHQQNYFAFSGIKKNEKPKIDMDFERLNEWIEGNTDSDFVNANMLELKLTGFMSNRGRQVVASYLIHELALDWRYGAAYFEQQLIDYDVCSNWGNWAYLAGVGNDPRGIRVFNSEKQAQQYDATNEYRKRWLTK
jgi:deoxyribodipyrimidine photo-lyase